MELQMFQKGFNYSQDGQGNRLVYHLQGCNMNCAWCANPEGMKLDEVHKTMTLEEICDEIKRSRPMFYDGGGVTFTGGEATMQFEPLKTLLKKLTEVGIHTALETNGTHPRLPELFPYIDQLIMDCKHWEEVAHKSYTGISLECVLENLWKAVARHPWVDIRTPIIGGVNDSDEDIRQFIKLYKKLSGEHVTFELLRYHEYGKKKWEERGLVYEMTEEARVSAERFQQIRQMVIDSGVIYKSS